VGQNQELHLMRHLQIYESFGSKNIEATVYTDVDQWIEFLKWTLGKEKSSIINRRFWEERFIVMSSIYTARSDENNAKTWFFSEYPESRYPKGTVMINFIKGGIIPRGVTPIEASSVSVMEKSLACTYEEIMSMAKTPEEHMVEDILENPDLIKSYSEVMPLTLARAESIGPDDLKKKIQAVLKWDKIKNYI